MVFVSDALMLFPFGDLQVVLALDLVEGDEADLGKVLQPVGYLLGLNLSNAERVALC
jgi:hypothetical protein